MAYKPDYLVRYIKPTIPLKEGEKYDDLLGMCPAQMFSGELKWLSIEEAKGQGMDIREATQEEIMGLIPRSS